jgi:hypothetical protein
MSSAAGRWSSGSPNGRPRIATGCCCAACPRTPSAAAVPTGGRGSQRDRPRSRSGRAAAVPTGGRGSQQAEGDPDPGVHHRGSGRPNGRPRIATARARRARATKPWAAAVPTGGRGSQHHRRQRRGREEAAAAVLTGGRGSQPVRCPHFRVGGEAAALPTGGRGSQLFRRRQGRRVRRGSGRPNGRPRIATTTLSGQSTSRPSSSGRSNGRPRIATRGALVHRVGAHAAAVPTAAEDRNSRSARLIRRHRDTGELAFYRCYCPQPVPLRELVRVAGRRWTVEESFQAGKAWPAWMNTRSAAGPPGDAGPCWP